MIGLLPEQDKKNLFEGSSGVYTIKKARHRGCATGFKPLKIAMKK